jgi:hypothetical protein
LYLAEDESIQLYEEPARRALPISSPLRRPAATSSAFPRKGRILMAVRLNLYACRLLLSACCSHFALWCVPQEEGVQTTGSQTLSVSSAGGSVDVCVTVSSHAKRLHTHKQPS